MITKGYKKQEDAPVIKQAGLGAAFEPQSVPEITELPADSQQRYAAALLKWKEDRATKKISGIAALDKSESKDEPK